MCEKALPAAAPWEPALKCLCRTLEGWRPHPLWGTGAGQLRPRRGDATRPLRVGCGTRPWVRHAGPLPSPSAGPCALGTCSRVGFTSLALTLFVQLRLS